MHTVEHGAFHFPASSWILIQALWARLFQNLVQEEREVCTRLL